MNVAFVFSGEIRNIEETKSFWLNQIKKYNADVFASFWDDYHETDNIENFNNIFKPIISEVESKELIKKTLISQINDINPPYNIILNFECDRIKNGNILYMTYKMWKSNSLTKLINKKYDIIIRCRTDIIFDDDFEIVKNDYFNVPKGLVFIHDIPNNWGFLDYFSYSKPEIMDYYSSFIFNFSHYLKQKVFIWSIEYLLRYHLNQKEISVRQSYSKFYRVDKNNKTQINSFSVMGEDIITHLTPYTLKKELLEQHKWNIENNIQVYRNSTKIL